MMLDREGREPRFALERVSSLGEAMRVLDESRIDAIILDLPLPCDAGGELLDQLAASHPRLPVIAVSADEGDTLRRATITHGAVDFFGENELNRRQLVDVLERKIEDAREQERLRTALFHNVDAVVVVDVAKHTITFANPAAQRLLGRSPRSVVGRPFPFNCEVGTVHEIEVLRPDGSALPAEMRVARIDWDQRPAHLASIRDIADRKRADQLQRRLVQTDRLAALGRLAFGVAHEIDNPAKTLRTNLEGMRNAVDDVRHKLVDDHEAARRLDEVDRMLADSEAGLSRMVDIVADLQRFTPQERQRRPGPVDLEEVVDVAVRMTRAEVGPRTQLELSLTSGLPPIDGDANRLAQMVTNLLLNAAQAMAEGKADEHRIRIETRLDRGRIHLTVADSGPGIPRALRDRVFEPFFTTRAGAGFVGMGLAWAADVARRHGGEIRVVESALGGAAVDVALPVTVDEGSREAPPLALSVRKARRPDPESRPRLILVDDEAAVRRAFHRMLSHDFEVATANGGSELIAQLEQGVGVDVIVCDLMMPELDGRDVYDYLRRRAPHLTSRILFCSGGVFTERMASFVAEHDPVILEKPVTRGRLFEAVAGLLDEHITSSAV